MGSSGALRNTVTGVDFTVTNGNIIDTGAGKFITGNLRTPTPLAQMIELNSTGMVVFNQSGTNPGAASAGRVSLYLRPGTTGSKLVVQGAGGTEFTVLDNIV